jgi:hypothetical protein
MNVKNIIGLVEKLFLIIIAVFTVEIVLILPNKVSVSNSSFLNGVIVSWKFRIEF